jgi:hypothetical protein
MEGKEGGGGRAWLEKEKKTNTQSSRPNSGIQNVI